MRGDKKRYVVQVIQRDVYESWIEVEATSKLEARQRAIAGPDGPLEQYEYQYTVSIRTGKVEEAPE